VSAGLDQRRAVEAAERALRLLGAGDGAAALRAAHHAAGLDRLGSFRGLPAAIGEAAAALASGTLPAEARRKLAAAVGEGPLAALVETLG
jgi:hypothetical protein